MSSEVQTDIEASPAVSTENSPTEKPTKVWKKKAIWAFFQRTWKAIRRPFICCRRNKVLPAQPADPELTSDPCSASFDQTPDEDPAIPEKTPDMQTEYPNQTPDTDLAVPGLSVPVLSGIEPSDAQLLHHQYVQGRIIGSGSYGTVYEGTCKLDGKKVAIKCMGKQENDRCLVIPGHSKTLNAEVALMLMMRQPPISTHVVQLYKWFEEPKEFVLIMENPHPCQNLVDFLKCHGRLNEAMACRLIRQAIQAAQHCLDRGVFHNDIHSLNILVNTQSLELKLIDFGCGKLLDSAGYSSQTWKGPLACCTPEVLTQLKYYAVPSTVWSLGAVLYEMVNGRLPFENVLDVICALRFWNPNVSSACRDVIYQCMNKDQMRRPTLEQLLQHEWFKDNN